MIILTVQVIFVKPNLTKKQIILKWTQKRKLTNWMITLLEIKLNFGQRVHPFMNKKNLVQVPMEVSKGAKIKNRYNQVPHLTQDTNGKVTNSQKTPQMRAKRSALSQQVTTKHI